MHREQVCQSPWIQCDYTTLDVQDLSRAPEIRTGHLWADRGELGEVVYDFTWSCNRDGPLKMLAGYRGYLQVDAAPAYDDVFAQYPEIVEVGCMAHARRYFKEAMSTAAIPCAQVLASLAATLQWLISRPICRLNWNSTWTRRLPDRRATQRSD
jgi:hypothetical protein